jgi:post-segregation antitoxin (ccd killing protein)
VIDNIKGKVFYSDRVVSTNDLQFDIFEGKVSSKDCKLIFAEKENVLSGSCRVNNLNIKQTFKTLNNFSQKVITDNNLEGNLTAIATLNLYFDKSFNFLADKSAFNVNYSISKGRLKDFSLMKKLSLFVEEEALNDVKFENLQSSLQFNNSSLNFEPIKVKTNIVDFECFGKHGLDNKIDYQFAINLLRNTKVFVKVEGFINDPKFKFNLQSDMKKVKEKVNQDKSEIIKSIDRDFKLNLEEAKKDKQEWEKQEKGEFIIEWEEEKQPKEEEKQFEDSDFIIEW